MKDELIISAYGSHNAAVAMYYKDTYTVIEIERWLNKKNAGMITYMPAGNPKIIFDEISEFLLAKTDRSDVDLYLTNYHDLNKIQPCFRFAHHRSFDHHEAHAATAFYQSPYDDSLTFTYDGGGDLGYFNVYRTDRRNGIVLLERFNQDLGFAYMIFANYLADITRDPLTIGNLVYAGKLMGLCSYGNVREEWLPAFTDFYETFSYFGDSYIGGAEAAADAMPVVMEAIGIEDFHRDTRIEGQTAWDIAATTQHVFEQQFFKFTQKYLDEYPDLPVTLSGGCALNVILNAKLLKMRDGKVFVPPNSNDCGVAVGGILAYLKPERTVDLTYSGVPILDDHMFSSYVENAPFTVIENVSVTDVANYINLGNIVGIIQGDSEHGPRSLGNRSIICNPVGDMKEVLNKKVKNREWYRPFAPVVRLEDATKYFDFPENAQSRHMTFVAEVREEYRDVIPAVTHEDNTGRLQTVTQQQNPFLYELITKFSEVADHAVLLNTSFNVNGKPILSRLSDALEILQKTELDAVYYKGRLVFRKGDEELYEREVVSTNIKPLDDGTTLYLLSLDIDPVVVATKHIPKIKEIIKTRKNIVLVPTVETLSLFKSEFGDEIQYFPLGTNLLFYHEMIQKKVPGIEMTVSGFKKFSRLLWIKNLMYKNYHQTQNHMFVIIDDVLDDENVENDINLIINLAKEDRKLIVSGGKYNGKFTDKDIKKLISRDVEINNLTPPTFDIIWGSIEQIEWLSVNFESNLLSLMRDGVVGDDIDYGLLLFVLHEDRFMVC